MALKVGDKLPVFKAKDADGNDFDSQEFVGKKPLVIYFYPKDNTPGCTAEACSFRDRFEDFKDLGAEIIGISSDSVVSHQKFAKQYKLPFILLSDEDKKIINLFGVPSGLLGLMPGRVTYVVDKNGIIKLIFNSSLMATKHISKALEVIKELAK
nr:peroxiredoxin [uncultured Flavobacterium sp.]